MTDVVIVSAARTAIGPEVVEHVVFGNVTHAEPADAYMGRVVGVKAGVPKETPAYAATVSAARACRRSFPGAGDPNRRGDRRAYGRRRVDEPRSLHRAGGSVGRSHGGDQDGRLGHGSPFHSVLMGVTAENLAERGSISRQRQDEFAAEAHRRAASARAHGRFDR